MTMTDRRLSVGERELMTALRVEWAEAVVGAFEYLENHCILAARVATEVGAYFGQLWSALPVDILLFNRRGLELAGEGVPVAQWPPDAWSVGCACDADPERFSGHMIVAGTEHLMDLSAGQFARPERDIDIEAWVLPKPPEPWVFSDDERGTIMRLTPRPEHRAYRKAPDWHWRGRPANKELTAELIRRLR